MNRPELLVWAFVILSAWLAVLVALDVRRIVRKRRAARMRARLEYARRCIWRGLERCPAAWGPKVTSW